MRVRLIVAAVLFQFLVLAWMAGEREFIYRTGRIVYLRTMPVDPQDHFRGDYVRLNYEISNIGNKLGPERGDLNSRSGILPLSRHNAAGSRVYYEF